MWMLSRAEKSDAHFPALWRNGAETAGPQVGETQMTLPSRAFKNQPLPTLQCRNSILRRPFPIVTSTKITMSEKKEFSEAFQKGLDLRGEVLGQEYVGRAVAMLDDEYWAPVQEWITEAGWAAIWSRPGLERKQRSLLSM